MEVIPCDRLKVADFLNAPGAQLEYTYDLGDCYRHRLRCQQLGRGTGKIELLAGARACPPEDGSGNWNYAEALEVLSQGVSNAEFADTVWKASHAANYEHMQRASPNTRFRFDVGDRVMCSAATWAPGTVVKHNYIQPGWTDSVPYQIRLEQEGHLIYAPKDDATCLYKIFDPAYFELEQAQQRLHAVVDPEGARRQRRKAARASVETASFACSCGLCSRGRSSEMSPGSAFSSS